MQVKSYFKTGLCIFLFLTAMLDGMLIQKYKLPPYFFIKSLYTALLPSEIQLPHPNIHRTIPKEYLGTDVSSLISIRQIDDVSDKRDLLIHFLWGKKGLPSMQPTVIKNWNDHRYKDIQSILRIDKLVVTMDFGLKSNIYHFIPETPNNKVVLYHQGHGGDFIKSKEQIRQLIDEGYNVFAFCMPLLGLNNNPTIDVPHIGKLKLTTHDIMKFLFPKDGNPIKYFIEPVIITLNYIEKNFDFYSISMIGISGGGWTTTLAAAVDTRIMHSFPVAGSYPIYLRSNSGRDWGDYEQNNPALYKSVNYLELYILGAYGKGRSQLQIINKFDPCCFAGIKWKTYKDIVTSRVHQLGQGKYDLYLDENNYDHKISKKTMAIIINTLKNDNIE